MFRAIFLVIVVVSITYGSTIPQIIPKPSRITGGIPIEVNDFSYVAALIYHYPGPNIYIQRCTGTILSSWHVLSTAFCFEGAVLSNMQVRAGSTVSTSGGVLVPIVDLKIHPDYTIQPRKADIALVRLLSPLEMSDTISVMFIPPGGTHLPDNFPLTVVGWGFETETGPQLDYLKRITLNIINHDICKARYSGSMFAPAEDTLCAAILDSNGVGICAGDWGAPAVIGNVVVGIGSHFQDCGDGQTPDVFTRVDEFTDWILEASS